MPSNHSLEAFAPLFQKNDYTEEEKWFIEPFFSNLDRSVYAPYIVSPELIGALCSRTSRALHDLRYHYLREFVKPFVDPVREEKDTDDAWNAKVAHGGTLREFIGFLHRHSLQELFSNPRARSFFIKWLAQYGDDSIAQMAGAHLCFSGLSQVAIKHIEDQRVGLAPIEKSTRYVNYGEKVNGHYLYYTDPTWKDHGLKQEYEKVMDGLFDAYRSLLPRMIEYLQKKFPEEKASVVEKKAFDTLRGMLPTSTLSQVTFFGNGQAFEYMISRSARHPLGEIRWAAEASYEELKTITPAFLRRLKDEERKESIEAYQDYLTRKADRVAPFAREAGLTVAAGNSESSPSVRLVEYDPEGENKIITGMLYASSQTHASWEDTYGAVQKMSAAKKKDVMDAYLEGRTQRWQKVGRAFENAYLRFDIMMNIGSWRDIHRHRMLTQQKQLFTCSHGYDTPQDVVDGGFEKEYRSAIDAVAALHSRIVDRDPYLAQYCVTLAHRVRFMQWTNVRQCFWEIELRTIPEGHPDYRHIEQEKFRLLEKAYPLITSYMRVNIGEYEFARRGQEERIQKKLHDLSATLT
ncbi:FAD-dependent thymidylate synthase [Candidatus Uhrbacteria bacterium]|nr:FAD-dependent thymidylate synthase [Candidatus Uhrbacteria bacterium]